MRICETEGCKEKYFSNGFCKKHHKIWYRSTDAGKVSRKKESQKYYESENGMKVRKEYMSVSLELRRTTKKKWIQTEKGKESTRISQKKRKKKFPEKERARRIARRNIKRTECVITGCIKLGERHHPDYSKPLDIIPLCGEHHREEEKKHVIIKEHFIDNYNKSYRMTNCNDNVDDHLSTRSLRK